MNYGADCLKCGRTPINCECKQKKMNLTKESQELDKAEIEEYLLKFGKLSVCKPIKDKQGNKLAKESYFLSLNSNSDLENSKFVQFCRQHNVILQLDVFSEF